MLFVGIETERGGINVEMEIVKTEKSSRKMAGKCMWWSFVWFQRKFGREIRVSNNNQN